MPSGGGDNRDNRDDRDNRDGGGVGTGNPARFPFAGLAGGTPALPEEQPLARGDACERAFFLARV